MIARNKVLGKTMTDEEYFSSMDNVIDQELGVEVNHKEEGADEVMPVIPQSLIIDQALLNTNPFINYRLDYPKVDSSAIYKILSKFLINHDEEKMLDDAEKVFEPSLLDTTNT